MPSDVANRPFLTAVDEARLKIRGSRDPLGLVPLWARFGRRVVGNLTTATTSVRSFTATLLGLHLVEQHVEGGRHAHEQRLNAFLRFEQLCGYARWECNTDSDLRGIREVQRRLEEQDTITIAADSSGQILSNQKTYGLWGLYTDPSRKSGFVELQALVLTPRARDYVEATLIPELTKASVLGRLRDIVRRERSSIEPRGRDKQLLKALGMTLAQGFSKAERVFYREYLVLGLAGSCPAQARFAKLVEQELPKAKEFDWEQLDKVLSAAQRSKDDELVRYLEDIRDLEALLIPFADLFGYLQARDGVPLSVVVKELRSEWPRGLRHINPKAIAQIADVVSSVYGGVSAADRLTGIADALHRGDLEAAVQLCLEHNAFVMQARGGAQPWVVVSNGRLDVRYRDESTADLLPAKELATSWRNGFYLNPLKNISDQLRAS